MKLSLEQIKRITQGAEAIRKENNAIHFFRFNDEELDLYRARPAFYPMAVSTVGIQLIFRTDADALTLRVTAPEGHLYHRYFSYDILVNEVLIGQLKNFPDNIENGHYDEIPRTEKPTEGHFSLGHGIKTVRIVFPWSMNLGLELLELENATFAEPAKKNKKLLIYGDSITQGACSLYPSRTYAALLGQWLDAETVSKAVGSECYYPELAQIKQNISPDYITVSYGCNDWYHLSREEFTDRCRRFWAAICENYPSAKKFALTPIWYLAPHDDRPFGAFEEVAGVIRSITAEFPDITVIDCTDFVSRNSADFGDLYVHPNHNGFQKFFQNLKGILMPYIKD